MRMAWLLQPQLLGPSLCASQLATISCMRAVKGHCTLQGQARLQQLAAVNGPMLAAKQEAVEELQSLTFHLVTAQHLSCQAVC